MIRYLIPVLALFAGSAQAQDCGTAQDRCEIPGGFYVASLPDDTPRGAVVFLHGYGGRAEGTVANRGLMNALNSRGYAVIAVQGMPRFEGDRGGSWNSMARGGARRDDVEFVDSVADHAAQRFGFNRENSILAGFSGGGMMTWRVACDAPTSFAAYAPIAGTLWNPLPETCAAAVRLFHTHGTSDDVVPLAGRTVGSGITQGDVFEVLDLQRTANGCSTSSPQAPVKSAIFEVQSWEDCAPDSDLTVALHPGGHAIPNGWTPMILDWYEALP